METIELGYRSSAINIDKSQAIVSSLSTDVTEISLDDAIIGQQSNEQDIIKQNKHYHDDVTQKDNFHGNAVATYSVHVRESDKTDNASSHLPKKLDVDELIDILKTFNQAHPSQNKITVNNEKMSGSHVPVQNMHKSASSESVYEQLVFSDDSQKDTTNPCVLNMESTSNGTKSNVQDVTQTQSAISTSSHSTSAQYSTSSTYTSTCKSTFKDSGVAQNIKDNTLENGHNQLPRNVQFSEDTMSFSKNDDLDPKDKSPDDGTNTDNVTPSVTVSISDKSFPQINPDEKDSNAGCLEKDNKTKDNSDKTDGKANKTSLPSQKRKRKQKKRPASLLCCVSNSSHVVSTIEFPFFFNFFNFY